MIFFCLGFGHTHPIFLLHNLPPFLDRRLASALEIGMSQKSCLTNSLGIQRLLFDKV
jgi:hypothetical protein